MHGTKNLQIQNYFALLIVQAKGLVSKDYAIAVKITLGVLANSK